VNADTYFLFQNLILKNLILVKKSGIINLEEKDQNPIQSLARIQTSKHLLEAPLKRMKKPATKRLPLKRTRDIMKRKRQYL